MSARAQLGSSASPAGRRSRLRAAALAALLAAVNPASSAAFEVAGDILPGDLVLGVGEVLSGSGHVEGALVAGPGATIALDAELSAAGGIELDPGALLVGHGVVSADLVNQGLVVGEGPAPGDALELSGDVSGAGEFAGDVVVTGTLRPGNSPACVPFENLILAPSATLEIEIGGLNPCAQYDRLVASGTVSIDGALTVLLIDGFVPALGNSFAFITAPSVTGSFSLFSLSLPPLPPGRAWALGVTGTEAKLTVVAPGGCGLLGIEPLALIAAARGFAARRRRSARS